MDATQIGSFLMQLNGLEVLGIGVVYILLSGIGKKWWNKNKKKDEPVDKNPHKVCPHYPDFKLQLREHADRLNKIFQISNYRTIKRQMAKVDTALSSSLDALMTNYVALLRKKYDSDDIDGSDRDVDYYDKILFQTMFHVKETIKNRIIENHILDKDEDAFRKYVDHANRNIISTTGALLDREYNSHYFLINRPELKEYNLSHMDDIEAILETMWYDIRSISQRANVEIEELEGE